MKKKEDATAEFGRNKYTEKLEKRTKLPKAYITIAEIIGKFCYKTFR